MKQKKRILAWVLCLLMLLSACANGSDAESDGGGNETQPAEESQETTAEETETEETLDIETTTYNGQTINILLTGWWEFYDFFAEETTAETLNDARYDTNAKVSNLLDVEISVINQSGQASGGAGVGYNMVNTMVMSDTRDFDFASIGTYDVSNLASQGKLLDLYEVPNIDLSKSWWDPKATEQLTIAGHMFFATGDASLIDNDCTYCILFNKQVVEDNGLEDPYTLVREKKWTFDKFVEMADVVDEDLDGDGEADNEDAYGILMWQDSVIGMLHASGGRFATINEEGQVELSLNTDRNVDVLTAWLTLKNNKMVDFLENGNFDEVTHAPFTGNRCLFYTRFLKAVSWFRNMETDFGILPYPMWDEAQGEYHNTMHAYANSFLCVPITTEDAARTGAVMEALSYYGKQILTPAYYDTTLKGKYFRDPESEDMLDLIFASRFFDVGTYYQIGGYNEKVLQMMREGNTNVSSMYASAEKAANKELRELNKAFTGEE